MRPVKGFVLALGLFVVGVAHADDPAARRVLTIDEQRDWSGVGRLNHSSGGFCSGALIAPDTVLTAAHCVVDQATDLPVPPRDLRFVAGLRAGVYTAHRRGAAAKIHPDWAGYRNGGEVIVEGDLAIVKLESPISGVEARQFDIGRAPGNNSNVTLVSYGRGRERALSIQDPCQIVQRFDRSGALNCDSVNGTSGAPVFHDGRIVGVISASDLIEGGRSYAVWVEGAIDVLTGGASPTVAPPPQLTSQDPTAPAPGVGGLFKSAPTGGSRLPGGKRAPVQ
ncbi:MAG: trypsin-like serine protease [Pseudomonadota bacterium]